MSVRVRIEQNIKCKICDLPMRNVFAIDYPFEVNFVYCCIHLVNGLANARTGSRHNEDSTARRYDTFTLDSCTGMENLHI